MDDFNYHSVLLVRVQNHAYDHELHVGVEGGILVNSTDLKSDYENAFKRICKGKYDQSKRFELSEFLLDEKLFVKSLRT